MSPVPGISARVTAGLAARAGLSPEAVSLLERGRRSPRMTTLSLLADALRLAGDERERFFAALLPAPPAPPPPRSLPSLEPPTFADPLLGRDERRKEDR